MSIDSSAKRVSQVQVVSVKENRHNSRYLSVECTHYRLQKKTFLIGEYKVILWSYCLCTFGDTHVSFDHFQKEINYGQANSFLGLLTLVCGVEKIQFGKIIIAGG